MLSDTCMDMCRQAHTIPVANIIIREPRISWR